MPIYRFKCTECQKEEEPILPMADRDNSRSCKCGGEERRILSLPAPPIMRPTGKDKVLGILNKEGGSPDFPGGDKHRPRYEQVMGNSLNYTRPLEERIFPGFG